MANLNDIFGWFSIGRTPTADQFKQSWSSFWHKSEKVSMSSIFGLENSLNDKASKEELANATTNNKGIYSTDRLLKAAYPTATNRKYFYAFVGTQNPFRKWEVQVDGGQWVDTGQDIDIADVDLTEYAKTETTDGTVIRTTNILKQPYTPISIFGDEENKLIECISDLSIIDYVGSRRIAINVAGFSTNNGYAIFQFRDVDSTAGFNFHLTDVTQKPTGTIHYKFEKDYQLKIEFSFDWDKQQKLYNSGDNLNLIVQSVHVAEKTIYGDSEVAKKTYLSTSKITDQEIKISKCIQNLTITDWAGSTEYRLRTIGWSNLGKYELFYFERVVDGKLQQFDLRSNNVKQTGVVHYEFENNQVSISFDFDWDLFFSSFSDRYTLATDGTRYLAFQTKNMKRLKENIFISRNFLQNSIVSYDNMNIARCFQNLQIFDYEKNNVDKYILLQQGWSNLSGYPVFIFERLKDSKLIQHNLSDITQKPTGVQHYELEKDNVLLSFDFNWDLFFSLFTNRYGGNSGLYIQSTYIEKFVIPKQSGDRISIRKGAKIMLVGASFSSSTNGWFELACYRLGITGINQAVGGSIIINNVVDKMMDANPSQPHGSLFMVDVVRKDGNGEPIKDKDGNILMEKKDIFFEVEAFVIMHTHLWDVYLEKSNTLEYYKEKYERGEEFTRAEAYDYVILQYQQWCAEYTKTVQIQGYDDVIGAKNCNILLCTHWHQSRDLYNDSIRKVAVKFGLPLCRFDENIGFSNDDFVTATLNTDANLTPTLGTYHRSILYTHYSEVKDGKQPRGKTENYKGVTYGWHPQERSTIINYGYPKESDGYYYPFIQYLMCGIFMGCVKVV